MSKPMMLCVKIVCVLLALSLSGCLMKRTVKEDGVTVAEGWVVKGPLDM